MNYPNERSLPVDKYKYNFLFRNRKNSLCSCLSAAIILVILLNETSAFPVYRGPKVNFQMEQDGGFSGSISSSNAFGGPGHAASHSFSHTFDVDPDGTFSGTNSVGGSQNFGGQSSSFANANAYGSSVGPHGFSSANSNAAANSFSNPFFQSSNAFSNANSNNFRLPFI